MVLIKKWTTTHYIERKYTQWWLEIMSSFMLDRYLKQKLVEILFWAPIISNVVIPFYNTPKTFGMKFYPNYKFILLREGWIERIFFRSAAIRDKRKSESGLSAVWSVISSYYFILENIEIFANHKKSWIIFRA